MAGDPSFPPDAGMMAGEEKIMERRERREEQAELQVALDKLQESLSFLEQSQADVAAQFQWLSDRVEKTEEWAGKTTKTLNYILDRVRNLHPHPEKITCKCGSFDGAEGEKCPLCGETIND